MKYLSRIGYYISVLFLLTSIVLNHESAYAQPTFRDKISGHKTAVVILAQNSMTERYAKNALSRIEGIFLDNAIEVLDKDKAEELKNVFNTLEDPGAFVTAETFVENAEKFAIKGLVAVYLSVDIIEGLAGYYSATAQSDIRFIDEADAKVGALTTFPMGAPGRPPSDGLTQHSAAINAVQRAIDDACLKLGLEIMDPATPRSVRLSLEGPSSLPSRSNKIRTSESDTSIARFAVLEKQKWRGEEITCNAKAPAGALGAVGGYIIDTDFRRRPQRLYGSRIHLIDLESKKEINVFECHPVEKKTSREKGTKKILDCMFVKNWRYLAAVTGNSLFLWDTERGVLLTSLYLIKPIKKAKLFLSQEDGQNYLVVDTGRKQLAYKLIRKK
jgi:hypothetical protein